MPNQLSKSARRDRQHSSTMPSCEGLIPCSRPFGEASKSSMDSLESYSPLKDVDAHWKLWVDRHTTDSPKEERSFRKWSFRTKNRKTSSPDRSATTTDARTSSETRASAIHERSQPIGPRDSRSQPRSPGSQRGASPEDQLPSLVLPEMVFSYDSKAAEIQNGDGRPNRLVALMRKLKVHTSSSF